MKMDVSATNVVVLKKLCFRFSAQFFATNAQKKNCSPILAMENLLLNVKQIEKKNGSS